MKDSRSQKENSEQEKMSAKQQMLKRKKDQDVEDPEQLANKISKPGKATKSNPTEEPR